MTVKTSNAMAVSDVIDAMRSIQTESDRWKLAEVLHQQVPQGVKGFAEIIDAAAAAGVDGGLKVNTLRLYRDTAVRWPADKRVANVSFSAHREAMVLPNVTAAAKMLTDLAKNLGPSKVTVASVRRAIAVSQGKPVPGAGTPSATARPAGAVVGFDVLVDIKAGAPRLIAAIGADTETKDLDSIQAGLGKALAHVERLRAKAARKANAAKPAATPKVIAKSDAAAKPAAARKPQGDLRGM